VAWCSRVSSISSSHSVIFFSFLEYLLFFLFNTRCRFSLINLIFFINLVNLKSFITRSSRHVGMENGNRYLNYSTFVSAKTCNMNVCIHILSKCGYWMNVSKFVLLYFSLSDFRSVQQKYEYTTFIRIRQELVNLFKVILSIISDWLFNFSINLNALKLFNRIYINNL
jgi:hypothetical protein